MLIYNKLTEIFADFRHFGRKVIILIFNYLHTKSSTKTAYRQHAGGKGQFLIVNKKLRIGGGTRRRPRCKYQAVHIQLLFVPLRRFSRCETASPPPSTAAKAVCSAAFIHIEKGLFWPQNSPFRRLFCRQRHIGCKYTNVRNSRYLGLLCVNPSTVPQGSVTGFINGKNAFMLVECVSPFPQYRDNDRMRLQAL